MAKTTARAFIQLKPLSNTNLSGIVEEHVRYWTKVKDDREARKLAAAAKQAQLATALATAKGKQFDLSLSGYQLDDTAGYFRSGIVNAFEANRQEYANLTQQKLFSNDVNAGLKAQSMQQRFQELTNLDKVAEAVQKKMIAQQNSKEGLDPLFDEPKKKILDVISSGNFIIEKDGGVKFPNMDTAIDGDWIDLSPGQAANYLNELGTFVGRTDFNALGKKIAGQIQLFDDNGNREVDLTIQTRGLNFAKDQFNNNPTSRDKWAFNRGFVTREQVANNFLETPEGSETFNNVATDFYNRSILPGLQERDNTLSNQSLLISIGARKAKLAAGQVSLATANGQPMNSLDSFELSGSPFVGSLGAVYNIGDGGIVVKDPGGTGQERLYTHYQLNDSKNGMIAIYDDVKVTFDKVGKRTVTTTSLKKNIEGGALALNQLATKIPKNDEGEKFKNTKELIDYSNSLINQGATEQQSAPPQFPFQQQQTTTRPKKKIKVRGLGN